MKAAKEVVNKSQDLGLREGVEFERRVFHGLFGSRDQKIGILPPFPTLRILLTLPLRHERFRG